MSKRAADLPLEAGRLEFGHDRRFGFSQRAGHHIRRTIEAASEGAAMVSKCSNPNCSASFLYLHTGKLFRFDEPNRRPAEKQNQKVQFFWLCQACAPKFSLVRDADTGARLVLLDMRARAASAAL